MYKVMCKVSGGSTGSRWAYLKKEDGSVFVTDNRDEAEKEVEKCRESVRRSGSLASFNYWVVGD
jgi:hypothetical protein